MSQAFRAWAAFKNMARAAARDPVWAVTAIVLAPIRAIKPLFYAVVLLSLVALVVVGGGHYGLGKLGFAAGTIPVLLLDTASVILLLTIAFCLITNPMIRHFGNIAGETHGSARFATAKEMAPFSQKSSGLIIGRDPKSKKLLRYDGPSHLITMAPTRTGKGVGTIIPNLLTADRSIICIDPKGENAKIAGRAREQFGPVHVLDPFGATVLSQTFGRRRVVLRCFPQSRSRTHLVTRLCQQGLAWR